jgi:sugar lactone lactonase YvrE
MELLPLELEHAGPGAERIVPKGTQIEMLDTSHVFTEGPVWDAEQGALYYTDIRANEICRWSPSDGKTVPMDMAGHPDGMALDGENRLVVAGWGSRAIWRWEKDGSTKTICTHENGLKLNSPNDIIVKSDESIYFTDPNGGLFNVAMGDFDIQKYIPYQGVYRVLPDGSNLQLLVDDFENPNGLCFSPDESLLYINDSPRQHIRVFDVQPDGTIKNDRLFAETKGTEEGVPDGMKVDIEGNVYVTGPGGIHVFDPVGKLIVVMKCPGPPANFAWGDADWKGNYVTARGLLYRIRQGIPGVPHGPANWRKVMGK